MRTSGPAESRKYEYTDHDLVATGSTSIADQAPTDASDSGANTGGVKVGQSTELTLDPLGSYVVVKPVDEAFSFRKINVFWPSKQLQCVCGTSKLSIECPSNGSMIVKTESSAQTKALLKITQFCSKPVTVSLHSVTGTRRGV